MVTTPLPDAALPETQVSSIHGSDAARARVRARNAADRRLRLYGMLAIGFAAAMLVVLLYNVFVRAANVLNEYTVTVSVDIAEDEDDFLGLVKSTVREEFPYITARKEKRALYDLISDGASDDMRNAARGGTLERGAGIERDFLLSDTVDLYLRGTFGSLEGQRVRGMLTPTEEGKSIALGSTADDFLPIVGALKEALRDRSDRLKRQAAMQQTGMTVMQRRLPDMPVAEQEAARAQITAFEAKRDGLLVQAAALDEAIVTPGGADMKLSRKMPSFFVKANGGILRITELTRTGALAMPLVPMHSLEAVEPGAWSLQMLAAPEGSRTISDLQVALVETLRADGRINTVANTRFLTSSDSTHPEIAGIKGAVIGSLLTMLVTFSLAFPIGVMAAIYLEEFAPKNRLTGFIEVNINNLAAVPSIVFGLLGLAVFLNFFGVPRSSPLAGGLVLAIMTLPTVIIASRAAIRAVPPSIRMAALGLGASKVQTVFHHVLPLAMPGILTGTIIGMAQALGETAPLLMIGMVAFITTVPESVTDAATVLPVQVFTWANNSERAFDARTAAAIVVLLAFLVVMNALAIFLRKRFERRW